MRISRSAAIISLTCLLASNFSAYEVALAAFPTLPNATATPGAINSQVTQQNIGSTICVSGFTATIRPPVSYTNALKRNQLRTSPYSSYGSTDLKLFEEDHLIPLELGGNPTSTKNLWPEPWNGTFGAHEKDQLENKLHALVCARTLALSEAQSAIATNWEAAYQKYILKITPSISEPSPSATPVETPTATASAEPTQTSTPPPSSPAAIPVVPVITPSPTSSSRPVGSTGKCNDGTYSYAATHRGMCSGHGGVAQFYI